MGSGVLAPPWAPRSSRSPWCGRRELHASRRVWGETELERLRRENQELKKIARLRRKNEELKSRLQEEAHPRNLSQGARSLFGLTHRGWSPPANLWQGGFPAMWEGFMSRPFWLMDSASEPARSTMDAVQDKALAGILHSGRLGSCLEAGPVSRSSYSSVEFNGQRVTQVQLSFGVEGERGSGLASCRASVGPDREVEIQDLWLDGDRVDAPPVEVDGSSV